MRKIMFLTILILSQQAYANELPKTYSLKSHNNESILLQQKRQNVYNEFLKKFEKLTSKCKFDNSEQKSVTVLFPQLAWNSFYSDSMGVATYTKFVNGNLKLIWCGNINYVKSKSNLIINNTYYKYMHNNGYSITNQFGKLPIYTGKLDGYTAFAQQSYKFNILSNGDIVNQKIIKISQGLSYPIIK